MKVPRLLVLAGALALVAGLLPATVAGKSDTVRFATFNASLNRNSAGQALADLSVPGNAQARAVAEIIQRVRPEVLLINEFDYYAPTADHPDGPLVDAFRTNYLEIGQGGAEPIEYDYAFVAESNTGIPSGFDLNNNGVVAGADDAFGFGFFPGQFGMAVLSQHPILADDIRTFQHFLWKDMPGALLPDDPNTAAPSDWYSPAELAVFRLSSKSHWDVPVDVDGTVVHFLVSHPTPPVFDGLEDRNGTRNSDEIRLWADYVTPGPTSAYIYDDAGTHGGLKPGALFVVAGDQNSDPLDGDSIPGSIQQLLDHPLVNDRLTPESLGAIEATALQGGANTSHESDPRYDTADFSDTAPGNLRADYVLPRVGIRILDAGVFWPLRDDPLFRLTGVFPFPSSDHRAVWVDLQIPG
ncbi:MAG TPA: endonuclease/exonuclease/phosphatase family protein [Candidatus Limnocylindrales bacterium]|nr:endonuclease/exonuclease/phosphatase family protein [Candidatus Limnocylindrales bacterium]